MFCFTSEQNQFILKKENKKKNSSFTLESCKLKFHISLLDFQSVFIFDVFHLHFKFVLHMTSVMSVFMYMHCI